MPSHDDSPAGPCHVISDLHLFTRRSEAELHQSAIEQAARRAGSLVLAGDIFDFRWSRWDSTDATAEAAIGWLTDLLAAAPGTELHYVLGNHDHMPALIHRLEVLAQSVPRFHWHPFHLRLGNALFLHGDAGQPGMTPERLVEYRGKFAIERPASEFQERVYGAVVALRLHVLGARLIFPSRGVVRRIAAHVEALGSVWSENVRNVYFGHTHLALDGVEHEGRRYHNCGSPMRGLSFRILEADLS